MAIDTTERDHERESLHHAFGSDNCAGLCPEALAALQAANADCVGSYGDDRWTRRATELIVEFLDHDCRVFFVFNGTAANSLALSALCQPFQSVICHRDSHVQTDECACPEFITGGSKLLTVGGDLCRVDLDEVERVARYERGVHFPSAKALTVTQATEAGTLYDAQQMAEIGALCRQLGLRLHVDGARFANAVAALDCHPSELTWQAGVDVMTLGGTKNGMAVGECVVFFNEELADAFEYRCKRAGQLASKMRFLTAPWVGMLERGAFLEHARHANRSARELAHQLDEIAGVEVAFPPPASAVFVRFPERVSEGLQQIGWHFYDLFGNGESRLMCSWATTAAQIDAFCSDVRKLV
jgi:threonine aldolase